MPLPSVAESVTALKDVFTSASSAPVPRVVLTVRLLFRSQGPVVSFELGPSDAGMNDADNTEWVLPYATLRRESDGVWTIRPSVADGLRERLAGAPFPHVLWLNLARPYGWLGTAPWEAVLGQALGCAVLRLPDFCERPAQRSDVLETALVVDPDPATDDRDVLRRVQVLVEAVLQSSKRTVTRVHVFTSSRRYAVLQPLADAARVLVHDPTHVQTSAEAYQEASETSAQVPRSAAWANWVAKILSGRGLDALHLLLRSSQHEAGADLLLSCSPSPRETPYPVVIEPAELRLLLDRSGAWAISFAPTSAGHEAGIAFVADGFAHERPGAVFFHGLADAGAEAETLAAFRTLFAAKPPPAPRLQGGFLHVHPDLVHPGSSLAGSEVFSLLAEQAALLAQRAPVSERLLSLATRVIPLVTTREPSLPPGWVGATQRFLESEVFDEVRRRSTDVLLSRLPGHDKLHQETLRHLDVKTNDVLVEIQSVVSSYLKTAKD